MSITEKVANCESFIGWLDEKIDGLPARSTARTQLAGGCLDSAHEYQKGIVTLVRHGLYGSAFALVRVIFEAYVRGVWLHHCASERDLKRFEINKLDKNFSEFIADIERLDGFNIGTLSTAKKTSFDAMNGFTHTGFHQIVRRNKVGTIEPAYDDAEILEVLDFTNAIAVLTAMEIAHLANNEALAKEISQKALLVLPPRP